MQNGPHGKRPKNCFRDPKSPFWQYDFSLRGERERGSTRECSSSGAAQFVEGRRALMRRRQVAESMGIVARAKKPVSLFEACALFEAKFSALDATTRYQIEYLCALLCPAGTDRMLSDIHTHDFAQYRRQRQARVGSHGRPLKGSTINREVELARRVWLHAAELGYDVGDMPKWKAVIFKRAEHNGTRYASSAEEQRLLAALDQVNPDLRFMAEFALISGQRKSAVVQLRWDDIDLATGYATFVLKTNGETKDNHTVPLTDRMVEIILSRPRAGPFVFTYECGRPAPRRGDRPARQKGVRYPFSKQGWARQWRKALAIAGITNFRWHDLRHTAATKLLQSSDNLRMVQELLGHKSIQQTARYAHLSRSQLRDGMQRCEAASARSVTATIVSLAA